MRERRRNKGKAEEEQLEAGRETTIQQVASSNCLRRQHWLGSDSFNHGEDWFLSVRGAVQVPEVWGAAGGLMRYRADSTPANGEDSSLVLKSVCS